MKHFSVDVNDVFLGEIVAEMSQFFLLIGQTRDHQCLVCWGEEGDATCMQWVEREVVLYLYKLGYFQPNG